MDAVAPRKTTEAQRQRAKVSSELRSLPSEVVATDVQDADKVHSNDAPHIIKGLLKRLAAEQAAGGKVDPSVVVKTAAQLRFVALCHDCGDKLPLTQKVVDIIRAKLLSEVAARILKNPEAKAVDFRVRHVWFTRADRGEAAGASVFELRDGPAPEGRERPEALKHLDLEVDVCVWADAAKADLDSVAPHVRATCDKVRNVWNRVRLGLPAKSNIILS